MMRKGNVGISKKAQRLGREIHIAFKKDDSAWYWNEKVGADTLLKKEWEQLNPESKARYYWCAQWILKNFERKKTK